MNLLDIASLLKVDSPFEILAKVIAENQSALNKTKIAIRLSLSSNITVTGIPIKMDDNHNVLFIKENKTVSYATVSKHNIYTIEILNPAPIISVLTNGNYFETPENEVPTKLEIKRLFEKLQDNLKSAYNIALDNESLTKALHTPQVKFQIKAFATNLETAINKIAQNELGHAALSTIKIIYLTDTDKDLTVTGNNEKINIAINLKKKFPANFEAQLLTRIETLL